MTEYILLLLFLLLNVDYFFKIVAMNKTKKWAQTFVLYILFNFYVKVKASFPKRGPVERNKMAKISTDIAL